jgi:hypothetical protein
MKNIMLNRCTRYVITCLFFLLLMMQDGEAHDTTFIKVHFLYGSKPLKQYRKSEPVWFGGILGGHVGIEGDPDRILNFVPHGKFHLFPQNVKHSRYAIDSVNYFYSRLGGQHPDSAKQAIVIIPVTLQQKHKFDSITAVYLQQTPYDYALAGMRCGAAAYEILSQLGIMPKLSLSQASLRIIYPKKLRVQLLAEARKNGWVIVRHNGTCHRKWETDD